MNPDELLNVAGIPDAELLRDLKELIRSADANKPRSLQRALGPSEAGHPCERRLAHGTVASRKDTTPIERGLNRFNDPLYAIRGTAMHTWLEDAVRFDNERRGRVRWIPEQRVTIRPAVFGPGGELLREPLAGTCDLYDVDTHTVIDWKNLGATTHKAFVQHGPSATYRGQAHFYGCGYRREFGLPVERVGIVSLPGTGGLRGAHIWTEAYSQELVDANLARLDRVETHITELGLMTGPAGFAEIPTSPDRDCHHCPWHSPTAVKGDPYHCIGDSKKEGRQ